MEIIKEIPIKVWQCPHEYAIVRQYDDTISFQFKYWNKPGQEDRRKCAMLEFKGVWAIRYTRFLKYRYYPNFESLEHASYLEIIGSEWLKELKKERSIWDPMWEKYDHRPYKHYIFQNNSYYIEIIASDVDFCIVPFPPESKLFWKH